jgi:hypothetical protein
MAVSLQTEASAAIVERLGHASRLMWFQCESKTA